MHMQSKTNANWNPIQIKKKSSKSKLVSDAIQEIFFNPIWFLKIQTLSHQIESKPNTNPVLYNPNPILILFNPKTILIQFRCYPNSIKIKPEYSKSIAYTIKIHSETNPTSVQFISHTNTIFILNPIQIQSEFNPNSNQFQTKSKSKHIPAQIIP